VALFRLAGVGVRPAPAAEWRRDTRTSGCVAGGALQFCAVLGRWRTCAPAVSARVSGCRNARQRRLRRPEAERSIRWLERGVPRTEYLMRSWDCGRVAGSIERRPRWRLGFWRRHGEPVGSRSERLYIFYFIITWALGFGIGHSYRARLAQLNFTCRAVFLENNSMSNFMSGGESHVFAASPCA
jgi:hypothetical protein